MLDYFDKITAVGISNCFSIPNISPHTITITIAVGHGPSGPSIEGPFCRAVRLCRTLETEKYRKKVKKKKENEEKGRRNRKKKRKK